ncbi:MAG: S8 family peptidase [Labilibaculum sp.]|nr:S8 family peptidase [Labilibaculum sp.]
MADNNKPHLLLKNQIRTIERFPKRGMVVSKKKNDEEEEEIEIKPYESKKKTLRNNLRSFNRHILERHQNRTIDIPAHIDYVKLYTHGVFNANLQKKFRTTYGLSAVKFEYFNKVVLCAIVDENAFEIFKEHIRFFIDTEANFNPLQTDYYLLVHIDRFELLSSDRILEFTRNEEAIAEIISNTELPNKSDNIEKALNEFLRQEKLLRIEFDYEIKLDYSLLVLKNTTEELNKQIVDNFDVIYKVQSHTYKTGPNRYGWQKRRPDFEIFPIENTTLVGIIDTGIQQNSPLRNIIENLQYDITSVDNPLPILDNEGHGTGIAMLAALGTEYYENETNNFHSPIKLVPIKVLENSNGNYSLIDFEKVIREANAIGVRIFNLSITDSNCKLYNETVSKQAFLLDKLSFELDILFIIATGNLSPDDIEYMRDNPNSLHDYPNHFFNPYKESEQHCCVGTNIHSPSESYNNIAVGAIAENLNDNESDLTYAKELPAYYSKKFHLNFAEKVNGVFLSQSLMNKNFFKPDLVAPGGDAIASLAGMEVLSTRAGQLTELSHGTSNAAPLVANIAARILNKYPELKAQSIKALLINSAGLSYNSNFLDEPIINIKDDFAREEFKKSIEELNNSERNKLSRIISKDRLFKYLTGHGLPDQTKALYSNENSATLVVEESIKVDCHKGLILKIPKYLNKLSNQEKKSVANITATLCYSFDPIFNNFLAYNPIHISFAFFNPVDDDLSKSIDLIAGYTSQQKDRDPNLKNRVEEANTNRKFKTGITWSEDYSPIGSKMFSNTQKLYIPFRIKDLNKIKNELNIVVRCTCKKDIDPEILNRIKLNPHPFSLVIRIEEKKVNNTLSGHLYHKLDAINTLEVIAEVDLEAEV